MSIPIHDRRNPPNVRVIRKDQSIHVRFEREDQAVELADADAKALAQDILVLGKQQVDRGHTRGMVKVIRPGWFQLLFEHPVMLEFAEADALAQCILRCLEDNGTE